MHEEVTTEQLFTNLKYRLKLIDTKVETVNERVEEEGPQILQIGGDITQICVEQKQMKERFDRLEKKIDALLNHSKLKWNEESTL